MLLLLLLLQGRTLQPPTPIPPRALDTRSIHPIHPSPYPVPRPCARTGTSTGTTQRLSQTGNPIPSRLLGCDRRRVRGELHLVRTDVLVIRGRDRWASIPILHGPVGGRVWPGLLLLGLRLRLRLQMPLVRGEQVVIPTPINPRSGIPAEPPFPKAYVSSVHRMIGHLPFPASILLMRMITGFFRQDAQPVQPRH